MERFETIMRWINVLVIFTTFFAYLSPFINPARFWQFSFFGLIYPWLLLCNVLFVFFWGFKKKLYFLFSLGCILLGYGHVKSFVGFNSFEDVKTKDVITVISYNVHNLTNLRKSLKTKEEKAKRENEFIFFLKRENEIQILCTQETSNKNVSKKIKEKFNFPFLHRSYKKSPVIFSKYPIFNSGVISFGGTSNSCLWVDINIKNQPIRVYNAHFQSNQISNIADKVATKGDIKSKETLKDIKGMMGKFRYFAKLRAQQAQQVANHMATCPHPIILCGDFNDTPQSYTYHLLAKKLKDTFKEKGKGLGTTYAGNIPALRIDYVLLNEKIKVHSHEILKENFSDHYPVICKISL